MSDDKELEVFRHVRAAQERFTYFFLTAAGSAVVFAILRTELSPFSWSLWPLLLALLLWGLSFLFGSKYLLSKISTLINNLILLQVAAGTDPLVGTDPIRQKFASDALQKEIEENIGRGARFGKWQYRLFLLGALFYLIWHVSMMVSGSNGSG